MFTTDCYYTASQRPRKNCQDYATCGNHPFPYTIICDGCSSSKNTDIGVRILTVLSRRYLSRLFERLERESYDLPYLCDWFGWYVITQSRNVVRDLGLDSSCMDATLILTFVWNKKVIIFMYGDGCVYSVSKSGYIRSEYVSYFKNAPFYLSYNLDPVREEDYRKIVSDAPKGLIKKLTSNTGDSLLEYNKPLLLTFDVNVYDLIITASDGANSFVDFNNMDSVDISNSLISIKSKAGEFIKRRSIRMIENFAKVNIYNTDDFSAGGIIIDEEKNEISNTG